MCCRDSTGQRPVVWAVVVAAGRGERTGLPYNKVFHPIGGEAALNRCLRALERASVFEGVVLVLGERDFEAYSELTNKHGQPPLVKRVAKGGANRQQSVLNGLKALPEGVDIVAVHDAARPFVSPEVVRATVDSALLYGSGVAATGVTDTIKRVNADNIATETLIREELRAVQTPQTFRLDWLMQAHLRAAEAGLNATDDAALVEALGKPVYLTVAQGGQANVKLTTNDDICAVGGNARAGTGYDVHRLVQGRALILCGVKIPFEMGLLGHSDADVAAHAAIDALLGAAAMGDIGMHFPDGDERYSGADSMALLREVAGKLRAAGFSPGNIDITIVAQRPKLAPYIKLMRANMARALGIDISLVSVKATTTEGLGFEGEGLGISAQAAAIIIS